MTRDKEDEEEMDLKRVVIFGATSAIAHEAARRFASDGAELMLVARDEEKLKAVQEDLKTRGASEAHSLTADLADASQHEELLEKIANAMPESDAVLIAYGTLGSQEESEASFDVAERELRVNFMSVVSLVTRIANLYEARGSGVIAVISSVAGDRGRKSNYVYGTAKGAVSLFLQGLRNRLAGKGVSVVTIKPGFVDTPMTAAFPKGPLFASAEAVGNGVYRAMRRGADVVYLPWFWRFIMLIIKLIPEAIFKRLSI